MDTGDDAFDELSGGAGDLARDSQNGMPTKTGTEVGAAVAEVRGADGFLEHELNEVKAASAGCEKVGKVDAAVAEGVAGEMTAGGQNDAAQAVVAGLFVAQNWDDSELADATEGFGVDLLEEILHCGDTLGVSLAGAVAIQEKMTLQKLFAHVFILFLLM